MFMSAPTPPQMETVWHGERGHYLTALRDIPPHQAGPPPADPEPDLPLPVLGRVIQVFRAQPRPLTVTEVAIRLQLSGHTARTAVDELCAVGVLERQQRCLFALMTQRDERYVLVGQG